MQKEMRISNAMRNLGQEGDQKKKNAEAKGDRSPSSSWLGNKGGLPDTLRVSKKERNKRRPEDKPSS